MVTEMTRAICIDILRVTSKTSFFNESEAKRLELMEAELEPSYPLALQAYLKKVSENKLIADFTEIMPVLSLNGSVFNEMKAWYKKDNAFTVALMASLREISFLPIMTKSELGKWKAQVEDSGDRYKRGLIRELQQLLLQVTGQDSPQMQIATEINDMGLQESCKLPGVPSLQVYRELLGGARRFYNGELIDNSWRSRVKNTLKILSTYGK